jgi:hypothetical protein
MATALWVTAPVEAPSALQQLRAPFDAQEGHIATSYHPNRGGHAPGHLRDWLYQFISDEIDPDDPPRLSLERLTGLLWNCTDIMPSDVRATLDGVLSALGCEERHVYTVAQACRQLRPNLGELQALSG